VLRLASSNSPEAAAHRASVAQRIGPFGHQGFPKPGQTATITVAPSGLLTVGGTLTMDPGGITVTVVVGVNDGGLRGSARPGPGSLQLLAGRPAN
jgi:hypothetical protein